MPDTYATPNADITPLSGLSEGEALVTPQPAPVAPPAAPAAQPMSLDALESRVFDDTPARLEMLTDTGQPTGITLLILSDQSPTVRQGMEKLLDAQRRADQMREAQGRNSRPGNEPLLSVAESVARNHKLVALRIAGWEGLTDPVTDDNKLRLLKVAPGWTDQILQKAREMTDFMEASPTT